MAASVTIIEKNGAGGTATDKTSGTVRFKRADDANTNTNDPMVIPTSAGTYNWSYEKWLRLKIGASGPTDKINNIKFYTGGTNPWTGVDIYSRSAGSFSTPALVSTTTGLTSIFTYTASGALSLSSGDYSGTSTEIGSHVVLAMRVGTTATVGALAATTITFSYDEI